MTEKTEQASVVIVGSGMAGLVTAVRALEHEADIILLEKGSRAGGKTYLSDGAIVVDKDGKSQLPFVEPLEDGLTWLQELGVELDELERQWGEDRDIQGKEINAPSFVDHMIDLIKSRGGEIHLNHAFEDLRTDDQETISSVIAYNEDNDPLRIETDSVVLCSGGFGGNEQLVERYLADSADDVFLRADPWSTGDGFLAAQEVGGKTTSGLSKFDGHSMIAPPATFLPHEFIEATQYYGPRSIALNWEGRRFTDESCSELEATLIQATAKKADGSAVYVVDQELYQTTWVGGHVGSMIERAREYGGNVIEAADFSTLRDRLNDWGIDGVTAIKTIKSFNSCVSSDSHENLIPPRERFRDPIDAPPYYAIEIKPGLTFTMGGLAVDEQCQVLRRSNTSSSMFTCPPDSAHETNEKPIKGLYAVGIDAGNPSPSYYIGALSRSLVGGRIAGKHAAEYSKMPC